jgi:putative cardiolipin synthase
MRSHRHLSLLVLVAFALSGCVTLSLDVPRPPSSTYTGPPAPELDGLWADNFSGPGADSAFRLVADGLDAFALRVQLMRRARHTLDLQYYIIHADETGQLLAAEVLRAADRGVRVRILLDDIYAADNDRALLALDSHPAIEIRLFNPWRRRSGVAGRMFDLIATGGRLNQRMHNKLLLADGVAGVLGGRNLGDEYFALHRELDFRDLDVLAVGAAGRSAGRSFDAFWASEYAVPATALRLARPPPTLAELQGAVETHSAAMASRPFALAIDDAPLARETAAGRLALQRAPGTVVADDPDKLSPRRRTRRDDLIAQLQAITGEPRRRLLISSPYFVPGRAGVERLGALHGAGVSIQVLTNSYRANDVRLVHVGYAKYRVPLLRGGVELFELRRRTAETVARARQQAFGSANASLHAKFVVLDERWLFVGSLNIDPRSIVHNTEIGVVIDSEVLANEAVRLFDQARAPEHSHAVRLAPGSRSRLEWHWVQDGAAQSSQIEPGTNAFERAMIRLLRWVPGLEAQI